jgi:hypothetical protein
MEIVKEVVTPIIQWIVMLGLGIWILYLIYWIISRTFGDFTLFIKYKVFRKKWDEKKVDWCMKAYEKGWNEVEIIKFLLLHKYKKKDINEILYYYENIVKAINKQQKGGNLQNVRIRPSNEQIKEIPSI